MKRERDGLQAQLDGLVWNDHPATLVLRRDIENLEAERDLAKWRIRRACAALVEIAGADGPCDLEDAVARVTDLTRLPTTSCVACQRGGYADTGVTCYGPIGILDCNVTRLQMERDEARAQRNEAFDRIDNITLILEAAHAGTNKPDFNALLRETLHWKKETDRAYNKADRSLVAEMRALTRAEAVLEAANGCSYRSCSMFGGGSQERRVPVDPARSWCNCLDRLSAAIAAPPAALDGRARARALREAATLVAAYRDTKPPPRAAEPEFAMPPTERTHHAYMRGAETGERTALYSAVCRLESLADAAEKEGTGG